MTVKDKANELIEMFYQSSPEMFGTGRAMEFGVKYSILTVDSIIKDKLKELEYWENVKNELKKLE